MTSNRTTQSNQTSDRKGRAGMPPRPAPPYAGGPSPWSNLLAEYMWQHRDARNRPLGVSQLAIRTGLNRATINTWVHRNKVPDFETILAVLRILNVPVERLFAFYRAAGVPLPPLTEAEAEAAEAQPGTEERPRAPMPALPATQSASAPPTREADPWDAMIASTVASLHELGIDEPAIAATVERIRATQAGQQHTPAIERRIAEEHQTRTDSPSPNQTDRQSAQWRTTQGAGR